MLLRLQLSERVVAEGSLLICQIAACASRKA